MESLKIVYLKGKGNGIFHLEKKMGQLRTLMRNYKSTEVIYAFKDTYISYYSDYLSIL